MFKEPRSREMESIELRENALDMPSHESRIHDQVSVPHHMFSRRRWSCWWSSKVNPEVPLDQDIRDYLGTSHGLT